MLFWRRDCVNGLIPAAQGCRTRRRVRRVRNECRRAAALRYHPWFLGRRKACRQANFQFAKKGDIGRDFRGEAPLFFTRTGAAMLAGAYSPIGFFRPSESLPSGELFWMRSAPFLHRFKHAVKLPNEKCGKIRTDVPNKCDSPITIDKQSVSWRYGSESSHYDCSLGLRTFCYGQNGTNTI